MSAAISIYVPTRNRADLLQRAIESVTRQTFRDWELLVVDDASTDETPSRLAAFTRADPRIRAFSMPSPQGAPAARNFALQRAAGTYVTGLDDDDCFLPHRLEAFWARRDELLQGRAIALHSDVLEIGRRGTKERRYPPVVTRDALKRRNPVGNQVFTHADSLRRIGGFDPQMPAWQDWETWYRLSEHGCFLNVGGFSYEQDSSHASGQISQGGEARLAAAFDRFLAKHGEQFSAAERAILRLNLLAYPQVRFGLLHVLRCKPPSAIPHYLRAYLAKRHHGRRYR